MNKFILIVVILAIGGGYVVLTRHLPSPPVTTTGPVSTGTPPAIPATIQPSPQPIPDAQETVHGTVMRSPICPVERNPPDPACAPKPFQISIRIQPSNPSAPFQSIESDISGAFSVVLAPGTYTFVVGNQQNALYPQCTDAHVTVVAEKSQTIHIECDTGIR